MSSPSVYELSSRNGNNSVISASNGTYILNDTSRYGGVIKAIVILENTKVDYFLETGLEGDRKNVYIANTGVDLKAGTIITPYNQNTFREIRLQTGSVALVL